MNSPKPILDSGQVSPCAEAAKRALVEARTVDEVKGILDKARALEVYAHRAKNPEMEVMAFEIRSVAERRAGELLIEMKKSGERDAGKGGDRKSRLQAETVKLPDLGITKTQSHRWQKLAGLSEAQFEVALNAAIEKLKAKISGDKKPKETPSTRPTAAQARKQARETGQPVQARDGRWHDGKTSKEMKRVGRRPA